MAAVLLWSQYSELSQKLYATITRMLPDVRVLCIDHPAIREKILTSSKVKVTNVPCILESSNSQLLQFEDEQAVQWVRMKVMQKMPPPPPPPPPQQQPQQDTLKFSMSANPEDNPQMPSGLPIAQTPQGYNMPQGMPQGMPQVPYQFPNTPQIPQMNITSDTSQELKFVMSSGPVKPSEGTATEMMGPLPQMQNPQMQGPLPQMQNPQMQTPQMQGSQMQTPQMQGPQGITPISMVVPEPPSQPQQSVYQQNLPQFTQTAQNHYQQYTQPQQGSHGLSPKEQTFQAVLAKAKESANM